MNWQEKFNNEIFNVVNKYENSFNIKIDSIELEEKNIDNIGKKTVNISSTYSECDILEENQVNRSFLGSVLLPAIGTFIVLATLMQLLD